MSTSCSSSNSNFAIYEWDGQAWVPIEECCAMGHQPNPPSDNGKFKGQRMVVACDQEPKNK